MTSEDVVQVGQQIAAKYTPGHPANKALLLALARFFRWRAAVRASLILRAWHWPSWLQSPPEPPSITNDLPAMEYSWPSLNPAAGGLMDQNRRRVPRFPFAASVELLEQKSGLKIKTRVTELSLYGCYVQTTDPLPQGTIFAVKIFTDTEYFESHATVVYAQPNRGMGLTFHDVKPYFLPVLKGWLLSALQAVQH
jgi:hypothetical protein